MWLCLSMFVNKYLGQKQVVSKNCSAANLPGVEFGCLLCRFSCPVKEVFFWDFTIAHNLRMPDF